jgi:hypothetical protein
MNKMRLSTQVLVAIFCVQLGLLMIFRSGLLAAHIDETIQFFSSDAANYFNLYEDLYANIALDESPTLFLIGSPILFMKLADGNLFLIQACNLALMGITLRVALDCFATRRGRMTFLAGALLFPYFLFGFLSLNKEVYAMCSAIFFASYIVRGKIFHLIVALLLAMCARYYMLIAMIALIVLIPRNDHPRYRWIFTLLILISLMGPIAKAFIPEYSSEGLLDVSGVTGLIFSSIIDIGGYALIYPIKYMAIIPQRAYSFLLGSGREGDAMEAIISIASLVVVALAIGIFFAKRPTTPLVRQLIVAGFAAPIPIMWSEIMHWRYFSFVYFFFLFAVILHAENNRKKFVAL